MIPPGEEATLLEVERALIGGCLADTRGVSAWPVDLMPGHFLSDRNGQIWEAMRDLTERSTRVDVVDLKHLLEARGIVFEGGIAPYLAQCLDEGFHAVDLRRYGQIVREGYGRRYRRAIAAQLMENPDDSAALERLLDDPAEEGLVLNLAQAHAERPAPLIATGFGPLDAQIRGVRPGTLIVVGGRTSHGKSSLLAFLTWKMAQRDVRVHVLELEETAYRLSERVAALMSNVLIHEADSLPEELYVDLGDLPIGVLRLPRVTESAVIAAVTASDAPVVIIDHIQQIPTPENASRAYGLETLLSRLAHVAIRQQKVVFVAAQLNRGVELRRGEPTLSDLRDSGGLEQIARQVWLLYWPSRHASDRDPHEYVIHVAKHSEGPVGKVLVRWDARSGQFWEGPPA